MGGCFPSSPAASTLRRVTSRCPKKSAPGPVWYPAHVPGSSHPSIAFGAAAALSLVAGCGARSPLELAAGQPVLEDAGAADVAEAPEAQPEAQAEASPSPSPVQGVANYECSPNDGLALDLVMSPDPLACTDTAQPPTRVVITIYRVPNGPGTVSFSTGGYGGGESCTQGQCVSATHVEVDFTSFSRFAITSRGSYVMGLSDGSVVQGSFVVRQCASQAQCG